MDRHIQVRISVGCIVDAVLLCFRKTECVYNRFTAENSTILVKQLKRCQRGWNEISDFIVPPLQFLASLYFWLRFESFGIL